MKKILSAVLFAAVFLNLSPAFAETKSTASVPAGTDYKQEAAYNKEVAEFYKQDAAYRKESWGKRTDMLKQMNELRKKKISSKDAVEKQNAEKELTAISKQMAQLSEEMAKKDIASAEFGLKNAQHRLERAKNNLARVQEANKKLTGA